LAAWFEETGFWEGYCPLMFDEKRWAEVPAVVDGIDGILAKRAARRIGPGTRVLDSCCGPGRHCLEFARRGCRVTGVDLMEGFLAAARESALADGLEIDFVRGDIREFVRSGSYELAINLFTSFGYFESAAEDRSALAALHACLAPGGILMIETNGKETAARDFIEGEWFERDGATICTEFSVVGAWEYLRNRWLVLKDGERLDRSFDLRLYSAVELESSLRAAGFGGAIDFYGDWDGRPYDQNAASLIVVAGG